MSEWQPIDTAPGGELLIACPIAKGGYYFAIARRGSSGQWRDGDGDHSPTHWMPLPEPPK
jgi:hypothetical protein